ncbi:glycinol 4-dimethylallyltransferase-like [Vigna angularis]|uniref:glycinol 4-dimethylallyltransferase-like n=1 Tax=Phaseolus angularis TaxID=3914 RepID=UPI00080A2684|nr:glycinol 4-dimethylallyltransferase-like [Vigna angularis]XP_052731180.1 glycinol 4-dimethylallyltransferase-like [Vigna angularis]
MATAHLISSPNVSSLTTGANLWGRKLSFNSIYYESSGGSKASKHNIKAQIQYNPLRSQQSLFNNQYKNTERGATYEENNKSYVVKAVAVPSSESESEVSNSKNIERGAIYEESHKSYVAKADNVPSSESESDASNSKNIVDSVKNFMAVVYQFIYPYAMYGRTSTTISASLVAVERLSDISPLFFIGLLQALIPSLFLDLYVNGVNQVFDFEIDKINKPHLPFASGKLSFKNCVFIVAASAILGLGLNLMIGSPPLIWNFVLNVVLVNCYSMNLPFLRWKQHPVLAALFVTTSLTLLFPISYFLHMQTFVLKKPLMFTRSLIVTLLFMGLYSTGIALSKDIPDVEGDIKHGVDSFAARLGQKKVFWICVSLFEMAFGVAFLAGASSSSPFWIKFAACLGNVVLGSILWYRAKDVDVTNPASSGSFYSFIWKLMMAGHVFLPLIR